MSGGGVLKVAVTILDASMVRLQEPVPLQPAPLQPSKLSPASGSAYSATLVSWVKTWLQSAPQSMPAGRLSTRPEPVPALAT
ncbi:hypothetical protein CKO42_09200 [Lamprobacter modestohalophilus]|uniref:Uncharacterized protein n=1 Tax=Lamprobacter modestohalophilus TaxID=1064514 RepID=A0A9X0W870_9GAMM|nr:hypothetical protein [Lamprobacter modestohalophilus]